MRIPLNRVISFVGPYIAVVSGALAAWLVAKVNVAAIPGLDQQNLATEIAAGGTFVLTSGLTWLGHSKWLQGHHIELIADGKIAAAAAAAPGAVENPGDEDELVDPDVDAVPDDQLPSDEDEFAAP